MSEKTDIAKLYREFEEALTRRRTEGGPPQLRWMRFSVGTARLDHAAVVRRACRKAVRSNSSGSFSDDNFCNTRSHYRERATGHSGRRKQPRNKGSQRSHRDSFPRI